MNCKRSLAERQAAMRKRQAGPATEIPVVTIRRACDIYNRLLCAGPALTEDVTAQLALAGIKHSASEEARRLLGVVEWVLPRTGAAWLRIDESKMVMW
jgi:hypothetical protein